MGQTAKININNPFHNINLQYNFLPQFSKPTHLQITTDDLRLRTKSKLIAAHTLTSSFYDRKENTECSVPGDSRVCITALTNYHQF